MISADVSKVIGVRPVRYIGVAARIAARGLLAATGNRRRASKQCEPDLAWRPWRHRRSDGCGGLWHSTVRWPTEISARCGRDSAWAPDDHDRSADRGDVRTCGIVGCAPIDRTAGVAALAELNSSKRTTIPSFVTVRLGFLTLAVGPADAPGAGRLVHHGSKAFTAYNELAYGFSAPSGCAPMLPPSGGAQLPARSGAHCVEWTFLNANTGKQIDSTWQKIGHWHMRTNSNAP